MKKETPNDQEQDVLPDREELDFDLSDDEDFTRSKEPNGTVFKRMNSADCEELIEDELSLQYSLDQKHQMELQSESAKFEADPKDPAFKMYQEMLFLMRDYSDVNPKAQDPLSSNYEAEFNQFVKEE